MEFSDIKRIVDNVSYKDMYISVSQDHRMENLLILMIRSVPNSDKKEEIIKVEYKASTPLDYIKDEQHLLLEIRERIIASEIHEVDEHILYKGDKIFDPHKDHKK